MSWIRKPGQLLGELQTYWGALLFVFPGLGALVSGLWAIAQHVPGYLVLFYGSGVFCFLVLAIDRLTNSFRESTIFGKLQAVAFNPLFGHDPAANNRDLVNCSVIVQNRSRFDIHYKILNMDLSLDGKTFPPGTSTEQATMVVPASSTVSLQFASIWDIKPGALSGDMKLRLIYGKSADKMPFTWEVLGEPQIGAATDSEGNILKVFGHIRFKEVKFY